MPSLQVLLFIGFPDMEIDMDFSNRSHNSLENPVNSVLTGLNKDLPIRKGESFINNDISCIKRPIDHHDNYHNYAVKGIQ